MKDIGGYMELSVQDTVSFMKIPCYVGKVTSCGETSIRITLEDRYIKILNYDDDNYEVRIYARGENYCSSFPILTRIMPKSLIGEYLSKFQ